MAFHRIAPVALYCLSATLLLTPACKDNEVIANYTCGDDDCSPEEDLNSCPRDCTGPLLPGPCTGDSTAQGPGEANFDHRFEYEMVDGYLRVTKFWEEHPGYSDGFSISFLFDDVGNMVAVEDDYDEDGVVETVEWFFLRC